MESFNQDSSYIGSEKMFLTSVTKGKNNKYSHRLFDSSAAKKKLPINQSLVDVKVNVESLLAKMLENRSDMNKGTIAAFDSPKTPPTKETRKATIEDILTMNKPSRTSSSKKLKERQIERLNNVNDSLCVTENENESEDSALFVGLNTAVRQIHNSFLLLSVFYLLTMNPLLLAFPELESQTLFTSFLIIDILFILDLILGFFTPFYNYDDELVTQNKKIAFHYLKSRFILDLVAAIPVTFWGKDSVNPVFKLIKLYKLTEFTSKSSSKSIKILDELKLSEKKSRVLSFCFWLLLSAHVLNGLWIYVGRFSENKALVSFLRKKNYTTIYINSLYFTLATVFTIGYGDVVPVNTAERLFSIFLMMFGVILYSYGVTSLSTVVTSYDQLTSKYKANVNILDDIKKRKKLPENLYARLLKFLNYDYKINMSQRTEFIKDLPRNAKITLVFNMYSSFIKNVKFLEDKSKSFIIKVIFSMTSMKVIKKEYLIYENEVVYEVFFVRNGILSVNLGAKFDEIKVINIRKNEHFGDVLAMSEERSPFNLKGAQNGDLLLLKKRDLEELAREFKEELEDVLKISFYNYAAMMEMAEQKKKGFLTEIAQPEVSIAESLDSLEKEVIQVQRFQRHKSEKRVSLSRKLLRRDERTNSIKVGHRFSSSRLLKVVSSTNLNRFKTDSNLWRAENYNKNTFSNLMVGGMSTLIDQRREIENNPQKFFRQKVAGIMEKQEKEGEIEKQVLRLNKVLRKIKQIPKEFVSSSDDS